MTQILWAAAVPATITTAKAQDASQDGKDPINHARTESVSTSVETETETETERERVCGSILLCLMMMMFTTIFAGD